MRTIGLLANIRVDFPAVPSEPKPFVMPEGEDLDRLLAVGRAAGMAEHTMRGILEGLVNQNLDQKRREKLFADLNALAAAGQAATSPTGNRYQRRRAAAQRASR